MTLYVINPNSSQNVTEGLSDAIAPLGAFGHPVECLTLPEGPPGSETQAQNDQVIAPTLRLALSLKDATGYVIACFSDPGVKELRQATTLPVLGIREAAMSYALTLGQRFGVVAIRPASIPRHLKAIDAAGLTSRLAGDRALDLGVTELADEDRTLTRLLQTACDLRDKDKADVLILGCAGMAHYRTRVEAATGLPTIDPTQAAVAIALGRILLAQSHSPKVPHA